MKNHFNTKKYFINSFKYKKMHLAKARSQTDKQTRKHTKADEFLIVKWPKI